MAPARYSHWVCQYHFLPIATLYTGGKMDSGPWGLLMGKVGMCVGCLCGAKDSWSGEERAQRLLSFSPEQPWPGEGAVPVAW